MTFNVRRRLRRAALGASAAVLILGLTPPAASASASNTGYGQFPMVIDVRRSTAEKCLSADLSAGNGAPITARICEDNATEAQWRVSVGHRESALHPLSVRLRNVGMNRCVDADTSTLFPYIDQQRSTYVIQVWACNGSEQQEWDVDRQQVGSDSRFLVENLSPARGPRYYLQARPANDERRGYLSMTQGPGHLVLSNGAAAYGAPFAIGSLPTLTLSVDSPGIRCAEAGFSGETVRVKIDPPTFRCQSPIFQTSGARRQASATTTRTG